MTDSYGTIINVQTVNLGEPTLADSLSGVSTLTVANAWAFEEKGGQVRVNGLILSYSSVDVASGLMTLSTPLGADVLLDTYVEVFPIAPVTTALVDFGIEESEAVPVVVPVGLAAMLPSGMREDADREIVLVEERASGELIVKDIPAAQPVIELATLPAAVLSNSLDGLPPASSPVPVVQPMIGALHVHWEAITNHDLVTYQIHISDVDSFTPTVDTLVGTTTATTMVVRTLPTDLLLVFDVPYFVKIVATDGDGAAPASAQGSGTIMKATSEDIAADYVYAGVISASQITGGTIAGDVLVGGSIRTADSGARVELDAGGITIYDATGAPETDLSTDGQSVFRGDAEISGLTVTGSMSIRGTANELSTAAELRLAAGITQGSTAPTVVQTWDSVLFTKSGDASFNPANLQSITWVSGLWVCGYQDGTVYRIYRFNPDGTYNSLGADPYTSSQSLASTQITAGGLVYTMKTGGIIRKHPAMSPTIVFQDDFTSDVATSRWPTKSGAWSWDATGIRAKLGTGDATIRTAYDKNIQGGYFSAKMARSGTTSGTQSMLMQLVIVQGANAGEVIAEIYTMGSQIHFNWFNPVTDDGFGDPGTALTYNATTHAYWKISESGGTIYFWTSSDGTTWTQRYSHAHTLSGGTMAATAFEFQNYQASNHTSYVDTVRHAGANDELLVNYSRINTSQNPAIGNDGTNILIAEYNASNQTIRVQTLSPTTLAVTSTITSDAHSWTGNLAGILKGTFDIGTTHFISKGIGSGAGLAGEWFALNSSGLFQNTQGFPPDNGGSRSIGWDGSNFWALGTDGKIYKHTGIMPSGTTPSVPYCAAFTWYDSNATGGTHETTKSPVASFSLKRRAKLTVTSPALPPGGGTDDPNSIRVYMGATSGALTLQSTTAAGIISAVYTSLSTGGAAPPGTNNFPSATAAMIKDNSGLLTISGDGSVTAAKVRGGLLLARLVSSGSLSPTTTTPTQVPGMSATLTFDSGFDYEYTLTADISRTVATNQPLRLHVFVDGAQATGTLGIVTSQGTAINVPRYTQSAMDWLTGLSAGSHLIQVMGYQDGAAAASWTVTAARLLIKRL